MVLRIQAVESSHRDWITLKLFKSVMDMAVEGLVTEIVLSLYAVLVTKNLGFIIYKKTRRKIRKKNQIITSF